MPAYSLHPLYNTHCNIKQRCGNPKHPGFANYGGRGIHLYPEWMTFPPFRDWAEANGWEPGKRLSIDRIDNMRGYSPDNCRWVDYATQNRNRRDNLFFTFAGETMCASDWARKIGISRATLKSRIKNGWPPERVFTTPALTRDQWANNKGRRHGDHQEDLTCSTSLRSVGWQ